MSTTRRAVLIVLLPFLLYGTASAQTPAQARQPTETQQPVLQKPAPVVTATAGSQQVRYVSLGEVHQTRLQVFNADGAQVFDSDFRLGNLIDWGLQDQQGQRLGAGSYLFLVTVKDFGENLTQKYGTAVLEQEQVYLEQTGRDSLAPAQAAALESNRRSDVLSAVDRIGAAGLNRTATPAAPSEGKPAAVNQPVTTQPATRVKSGQSDLSTIAVAGAGTTGRLVKWTDNSGTLGDSAFFQGSGGGVAIGTTDLSDVLATGNDMFKVVDGPMSFSFRDFFGGQGYFAVGSSSNGIKGFVGHTNNTDGFTMGTFSDHRLTMRTNNTNRMTIDSLGNMGVGTMDLSDILVAGNDRLKVVDGAMTLSFRDFASGQGYLAIGSSTNGIKGFVGHTNTADGFTMGTSSGHRLTLRTNSLNRMTIDPAGNVGIGTMSPQARLDVGGDISVSGNAVVAGNIAAKYQDVAEWVRSSQKLATGTVVVLDTTSVNAVSASRTAYDTHVAGVVSAQPGVILGEGGVGKVMVATTGRVKVRVDAGRYPIKIGDLLVTSARPGFAMKSRPLRAGSALIHRPGTIIGKALEPLAKGEGEILVLLSLQ